MSEISSKGIETMSNTSTVSMSSSPTPNELKKTVKILESPSVMNHVTPAGISRERSFVRTSNPQNHHQVKFKVFLKSHSRNNCRCSLEHQQTPKPWLSASPTANENKTGVGNLSTAK